MVGYDKYIVAFSGGKDSIACFLHLLKSGVPAEKIELWHHLIDGDGEVFMDWEVTESYCRQFAAAFNVPIYFSWRVGGFHGEMMRKETPTGAVVFEDGNGQRQTVGGQSNSLGTRRKGTISDLIAKGQAYAMTAEGIALATSTTYSETIRISPSDWKLPPGAFGEGCGPV